MRYVPSPTRLRLRFCHMRSRLQSNFISPAFISNNTATPHILPSTTMRRDCVAIPTMYAATMPSASGIYARVASTLRSVILRRRYASFRSAIPIPMTANRSTTSGSPSAGRIATARPIPASIKRRGTAHGRTPDISNALR